MKNAEQNCSAFFMIYFSLYPQFGHSVSSGEIFAKQFGHSSFCGEFVKSFSFSGIISINFVSISSKHMYFFLFNSSSSFDNLISSFNAVLAVLINTCVTDNIVEIIPMLINTSIIAFRICNVANKYIEYVMTKIVKIPANVYRNFSLRLMSFIIASTSLLCSFSGAFNFSFSIIFFSFNKKCAISCEMTHTVVSRKVVTPN